MGGVGSACAGEESAFVSALFLPLRLGFALALALEKTDVRGGTHTHTLKMLRTQFERCWAPVYKLFHTQYTVTSDRIELQIDIVCVI